MGNFKIVTCMSGCVRLWVYGCVCLCACACARAQARASKQKGRERVGKHEIKTLS